MPRKKILLYCWQSTDGKQWRKINFELLFKRSDCQYAVTSALHNFFLVRNMQELEDLHFKLPTDPILTPEQAIKMRRKIDAVLTVIDMLEDLRLLSYSEYADTKHGLMLALERLKQFR